MKGWIGFDTLGNRLSPIVFDTVPYYLNGNNTVLYGRCNGKEGVVSNSFQWVIPPQYQKLTILTPWHFMVTAKDGRIGLLDKNNQLVIDTVYSCFQPIFSNQLWQEKDKERVKRIWLFKNEIDRKLVIQSNGKFYIEEKKEIIDSILFRIAYINTNFDFIGASEDITFTNTKYSHYNESTVSLRIILPIDYFKSEEKLDFKEELYDLMNESYEKNIDLYKNYDIKPINQYQSASPSIFEEQSIQYIGSTFVSLVNKQFINAPIVREGNENTYINYLLQFGGLCPVSLKNIFSNETHFLDELVLAFSKRSDLDLGCLSTEGFYELFQNHFSLNEKGIILHVRKSIPSNPYRYEELLIPIDRLALYPETSWIISYLK